MIIEDHRSNFLPNKEGHLLCFEITQANICSCLLGKFLPCLLSVQISSAALREKPLLPRGTVESANQRDYHGVLLSAMAQAQSYQDCGSFSVSTAL